MMLILLPELRRGPSFEKPTRKQGGGVSMEENSTSSVKAITLLFISGAVLGSVAGILFAPKPGKETRKEIKHYAMKVKKDVASTADRKSTRLNSSHGYISYAVFCLKKKKHEHTARD